MPYKDGTKSGGRTKGTPNKNKDEFSAKLSAAAKDAGFYGFDILKELSELYFQLKEGDPCKAADLVVRMMEYQFPKKKAVEVTGSDGGPVEVDLTFAVRKFDELAGDE